MLALIAALLIALSAFGVHLDAIDLFKLGIAFLALHFAYEIALPIATRRHD